MTDPPAKAERLATARVVWAKAVDSYLRAAAELKHAEDALADIEAEP